MAMAAGTFRGLLVSCRAAALRGQRGDFQQSPRRKEPRSGWTFADAQALASRLPMLQAAVTMGLDGLAIFVAAGVIGDGSGANCWHGTPVGCGAVMPRRPDS